MPNQVTYVCPITEYDYEDVLKHLRNNFFADEPLNHSVGLCEPGQHHKDLEDHSLLTLKDGLSIKAVETGTNKIIGVALNGVLKRPNCQEADQNKTSSVQDEKFKRIFDLLHSVNEELDLFNKYRVDKLYECRMLSVDQNHRGQGIAKELLKRSIEEARSKGFKLFKQDATSFYTQKISESLGFDTVFELYYRSYLGDDGQPVFTPPAPHKYLKVVVKILQ